MQCCRSVLWVVEVRVKFFFRSMVAMEISGLPDIGIR